MGGSMVAGAKIVSRKKTAPPWLCTVAMLAAAVPAVSTADALLLQAARVEQIVSTANVVAVNFRVVAVLNVSH